MEIQVEDPLPNEDKHHKQIGSSETTTTITKDVHAFLFGNDTVDNGRASDNGGNKESLVGLNSNEKNYFENLDLPCNRPYTEEGNHTVMMSTCPAAATSSTPTLYSTPTAKQNYPIISVITPPQSTGDQKPLQPTAILKVQSGPGPGQLPVLRLQETSTPVVVANSQHTVSGVTLPRPQLGQNIQAILTQKTGINITGNSFLPTVSNEPTTMQTLRAPGPPNSSPLKLHVASTPQTATTVPVACTAKPGMTLLRLSAPGGVPLNGNKVLTLPPMLRSNASPRTVYYLQRTTPTLQPPNLQLVPTSTCLPAANSGVTRPVRKEKAGVGVNQAGDLTLKGTTPQSQGGSTCVSQSVPSVITLSLQLKPPSKLPTFSVAGGQAVTTTSTATSAQHQTSPMSNRNKNGQIKRPMNAFMVWARTYRPYLAGQMLNATNSEVSIRLGQVWNSMTEAQKKPYYEEAESIKQKHKIDYPDWVYKPKPKRREVQPWQQYFVASRSAIDPATPDHQAMTVATPSGSEAVSPGGTSSELLLTNQHVPTQPQVQQSQRTGQTRSRVDQQEPIQLQSQTLPSVQQLHGQAPLALQLQNQIQLPLHIESSVPHQYHLQHQARPQLSQAAAKPLYIQAPIPSNFSPVRLQYTYVTNQAGVSQVQPLTPRGRPPTVSVRKTVTVPQVTTSLLSPLISSSTMSSPAGKTRSHTALPPLTSAIFSQPLKTDSLSVSVMDLMAPSTSGITDQTEPPNTHQEPKSSEASPLKTESGQLSKVTEEATASSQQVLACSTTVKADNEKSSSDVTVQETPIVPDNANSAETTNSAQPADGNVGKERSLSETSVGQRTSATRGLTRPGAPPGGSSGPDFDWWRFPFNPYQLDDYYRHVADKPNVANTNFTEDVNIDDVEEEEEEEDIHLFGDTTHWQDFCDPYNPYYFDYNYGRWMEPRFNMPAVEMRRWARYMNCPPEPPSMNPQDDPGRSGSFKHFFDPYGMPPRAPWVASPYRFVRHPHTTDSHRCSCKQKDVTSVEKSKPPAEGTHQSSDSGKKKEESAATADSVREGAANGEGEPGAVAAGLDAADSGTDNSDSSSPEDVKRTTRHSTRHQSSLPLRKRARHT